MRHTFWKSLVVLVAAMLTIAGSATASDTTGQQAPNAAAFTVSPAQQVDPYRGRPHALSCPTTTFCMALDRSGTMQTWSAGRWSVQRRILPSSSRLSPGLACPSTTLCVAVYPELNRIGFYRGGTWIFRAATRPWAFVDCATATTCVLATRGQPSYVAFLVGTTVGTATALPIVVDDIACSGACILGAHSAHRYGYVVRRVGTTWTWRAVMGNTYGVAVSCSSSVSCVAVGSMTGNHGQWARFDGSTWRTTVLTNSMFAVDDIVCGASLRCWATSPFSRYRLVGTTWTEQRRRLLEPGNDVAPDDFTAVDCAGPAFCQEVGESGFGSTFDGRAWSTPRSVAMGAGDLGDVSCGSSTFCLAADAHGKTLTFNGRTWSALRSTAWGPIRSSCVSTWCMVFEEYEDAWRTYSAGTWSAPAHVTLPADRTTEVLRESKPACVDRAWCVTMSGDGAILRWDGTRWTLGQQLYPSWRSSVASISCVSRTSCLLIQNVDRTWSRWNGVTWSAPRTLPANHSSQEFLRVSCGTATFCVASNPYESLRFNGTSWSASLPSGDNGNPEAFQCFPDLTCLGAANRYDGAALLSSTGAGWLSTGVRFTTRQNLFAISPTGFTCGGSRVCVLVGGEYAGIARR